MVEDRLTKDSPVYPFHSRPDQAATTQQEVQRLFDAKRTKNIAAGEVALSTGEFKLFTGFSREGMNKLFVLELELSDASRKEIGEKVVEPMKAIASELGISEMIFAGEGDQDPHVSLHVGRFDNMTPKEQEKIRQWLIEGSEDSIRLRPTGAGKPKDNPKPISHLRRAADILTGLKFNIDTVVCSGRDTYICAGKAEGNQGAAYRVRRIFDRALERAQRKFVTSETGKIGPHYPRYDDIFHISVARFTGKVEPYKLTAFKQRVDSEIGKRLAETPVKIEIENAGLIIATQGVEKRKPELLT